MAMAGKRRFAEAENWREVEDYLNTNFQNDTRPRKVEVDVPMALEIQEHLRTYATTWLEANYRLNDWSQHQHLMAEINRQTICLMQAESPSGITKGGADVDTDARPFAVSHRDADRGVDPDDPVAELHDEGRRQAAWLFFEFITSQYWNQLRTCKRCGRFFVCISEHNRVFCSRNCANAATALASTRIQREQAYREKLARVRAAMAVFRRLPQSQLRQADRTPVDWKRWVAKQTDIDLRFITQAVNRHRLSPPKDLSVSSKSTGGKNG